MRKTAASEGVLNRTEIETLVRELLRKYNGEYALLFGSYARGDCTSDSDLDLIVFGGKDFKPIDIFAFGEDLRTLTHKKADVFEIREVDPESDFYHSALRDGVRIA